MKIQIARNEVLKNMPSYIRNSVNMNLIMYKGDSDPEDTVNAFKWSSSIEELLSPGFEGIWSQIASGKEVVINQTIKRYWDSLQKISKNRNELVFTTKDYREYSADLNGQTIKITLQVK